MMATAQILTPMIVGSKRRYCYGYHQGPDALEFHVCRERFGRARYTIHMMRRFEVWGRQTYGLCLFGDAATLHEAQRFIATTIGRVVDALAQPIP